MTLAKAGAVKIPTSRPHRLALTMRRNTQDSFCQARPPSGSRVTLHNGAIARPLTASRKQVEMALQGSCRGAGQRRSADMMLSRWSENALRCSTALALGLLLAAAADAAHVPVVGDTAPSYVGYGL